MTATSTFAKRKEVTQEDSIRIMELWHIHTRADRIDVPAIERHYPRAARLAPKAQAALRKAVVKARRSRR